MGELRVEQLSKAFPTAQKWGRSKWHTIFNNLQFSIKSGEFVCVIGPSGCGKSTLLSIAAGLEEASSGSVYVNDSPVRGPGLDRGVVFQEFALFPWLTVRGNIAFGLKSKGVPQAEVLARADKYVDLVGLSKFADYYPSRLSGGMRQRVGLGRALAIEPSVLLMDEPFGALDALTRENMELVLSDSWQETRKTVLFITHDIDEAVFLSDRVLVLNETPSRIVCELKIDLPRARDRSDPQFQRLVKQLDSAIRGDNNTTKHFGDN